MSSSVLAFQNTVQYHFKQPWLLLQAFTHRSFAQENNERLEFLGDTVLNLAITHLLFQRYPSIREGVLSRSRSTLVCQDSLHQIAINLSISNYLRLGDGELQSGGLTRPSLLADAVEALLGAVFLDCGDYDIAFKLVERLYEPLLNQFEPGHQQKDSKSLLQEIVQARHQSRPIYTVMNIEGAEHQQMFKVECHVPVWNLKATGTGLSRKIAEQIAASQLLNQFQNKNK